MKYSTKFNLLNQKHLRKLFFQGMRPPTMDHYRRAVSRVP